MKKILILLLIFCLLIPSGIAFARVKKVKCKKPIYYFEDSNKEQLFEAIDGLSQEKQWDVKKYYPQLGFMSLNHKTFNKCELVMITLKQYGNDIYLFIDISKRNSELEKSIYQKLKPLAKKSTLISDNQFCKELSQDAIAINTTRKTKIKEVAKDENTYRIGVNRYIGYDKKTYFSDKLKNLFKKKKKKTKQEKV